MKKELIRVLSGMLALTLLCGCSNRQQPPEEPTSINQALLIEHSAQPQPAYPFPDCFTGDWAGQDGKLTIHANAPVTAELGTALPIATVTPKRFDQSDLDNLRQTVLQGADLYDSISTKEELQEGLDFVRSDRWHTDPDSPALTETQLEARRQELIDRYEAEIERAPVEKPVINSFSDSRDPERITAIATTDGIPMVVYIDTNAGIAHIRREDHECSTHNSSSQGSPSEADAIARGDDLMRQLGLEQMVCDDVQPCSNGTLMLYYVPSVNGIPLSSIRVDGTEKEGGTFHAYWNYSSSEEKNPDPVSWYMESIQVCVGTDGIHSFRWQSPSGPLQLMHTQAALLPFETIAAIADTMLPVVITGPTEALSLTELDNLNGFDTNMEVEITKVSLSLMRIRDKGTLQGTIVPVWDFWGSWTWHEAGKAPENYHTQPMLTLNAVDGSVVSRQFGY